MSRDLDALEDLDDDEALLVYADALSEAGDPRGELCVVQHRLEANPDDVGLRAREAALIEAHGKAWLGEVYRLTDVAVTWRRGFVDAVRTRTAYKWDDDRSINEVLGPLLDLPVSRLVRELVLGQWMDEPGEFDVGKVGEVLAARPFPSLRRLVISDVELWGELTWSHVGDLSRVWTNLPNLERLTLHLGELTLGELELPRLRTLELAIGRRPAALQSVATARWPALEELSLHLGPRPGGTRQTIDHLAALVAGVPTLRTIRLTGMITSDGAKALAEGRAAFAKLELLDRTEAGE